MTFYEIEMLIGSSFDDYLRGGPETILLRGGDGNDVLEAFGFTPTTMVGGAGNDVILGQQLSDFIDGGSR